MLKKIFHYIGSNLCNISKEKEIYPNLLGDRDIEWSFIAAHLPTGPGYALDFGTGESSMGLMAARKKYCVTAIDLGKISWSYIHTNLEFIQGDILDLPFPEHKFDVIINCSTVEHVGLPGRYNVSESKPDGDIDAMERLKKLMKPNGCMLITIPIGKDAVFMPLHRVYGNERLPKLFKGYIIEYEEFWLKNDKNQWVMADKTEALMKEPQAYLYGLGCFILRCG